MSHLSRQPGFFLVAVFAVVLLLTQAAVTTAETVQIESARDNTLIQSSSGSRSLGEGDIFVGLNDDENLIRRGLVAFDVASNVPAGATIDSVMLRMYVDKTRVGNREVSLRRVLADWGETDSGSSGTGGSGTGANDGDATWLHTFHDDQFWTNPGGDFSATSSATQMVGGDEAFYTWDSTAQMVADVQHWLDNPSEDFGWLLLGDESRRSSKRFQSRESSTSSEHPWLTISYAPIPVLAADFDVDGDVDGDDFLAWQTGFGIASGATKADGDYDNDGDVDSEDSLGWQSEFGSGNGAASMAVPEPSSMAMVLGMAILGVLSRRGGINQRPL